MEWKACLLVLAACVWPGNAVMQLRLLPNIPDARCLDGSPSGYYVEVGATKGRWVISLEGGGICTLDTPPLPEKDGLNTCAERAKTRLGTSTLWAKETYGSNMLSVNATTNPDFADWSHVLVPYCDGSCHLGNRTEVGPGGMWYSGHRSLMAIIDDLRVVLTGGSAGGIGTIGNVDFLAEALPQADVRGVPNAGFFPYIQPYKGGGWKLINDLNMNLSRAIAPPACMAAHPNDPSTCHDGPIGASPLLFAEFLFDKIQMFNFAQAPNETTPEGKKFIRNFGEIMADDIKSVLHKRSDCGAFAPACISHNVPWGGFTVHKQTQTETVGCWYFKRRGCKASVIDTPEYPKLNPGC